MNLAQLEKKLLAAARSVSVSDTVPYAFEKRIMAQIAPRKTYDVWSWWAGALWRAAAPCVGIMILFSAWSYYNSNSGGSDLSQEFENTVLAVVQQEQPADSSW